MKIFWLILFSFLARILLLIIERSMGIGWDYHADSNYYVSYILQIENNDFFSSIKNINFLLNNLYPITCYFLYIITGKIVNLPDLMIGFNICISLFTIKIITKLYETNKGSVRKLIWPGVFFAFSPYLVHLTIHPLKDIFTIFLGIVFLYTLLRNYWYFVFLAGLGLILSRFNFGILIVIMLLTWRLLNIINCNGLYKSQTFILLILIFLFYIINETTISDRLDVVYDGREFYENGFALIPEIPWVRYFFGGILNFIVPFPFIPLSLVELGYFGHWVYFIIISIILILRNYLYESQFSHENLGLLICIFFFFGFVMVTTPSAGPFVRYRLFPELLFLIVIYGERFRSAHSTSNKFWF